MPLYKHKVDLYWTGEGDFHLSDQKDLLDTKNYHYRGLIQQILNRVMSTRGDWPLRKSVGANLEEFLGESNSRATAQLIQTRILSELARGGLISPSDLKVDIIPVAAHMIMIIVSLTPPQSRKAISLNFSYNMADNKFVARNI